MSSDDEGFIDQGGTSGPGSALNVCTKAVEGPLAMGLRIRELALYQTVKITLARDGAWISKRPAPVIQGKQALIRVLIDTLEDYDAHSVRAVLRIDNEGELTELVDERTLTGSSTEGDLESAFSFPVPGALLKAKTQLSVSLEEVSCTDEVGEEVDARYPELGSQALDASAVGKLKVVVVPIRVGGRVPVTTPAELANMRATLLAYYPVPDVEVTARAPLEWDKDVAALDGASWSNLLTQVMRERRTDGPTDDVYYFGLVQPGASFRVYCQRGCVLGLAPQTTSVMPTAQVGLGASFGDAQTYETMVHEIGHAHGRGHAPCVENGEIDGVDMDFPEPTGNTATWGWDSRTNQLQSPGNKDIMGYCEPNWIGAYNYAGLASRSLEVNTKALRVGVSDVRWQHVVLYGDRTARWGGSVETTMPSGNIELAQVLDASGRVIEEVDVVRIPLSHGGDEFVYVPETKPGWAAFQLRDVTLVIEQIKPAL